MKKKGRRDKLGQPVLLRSLLHVVERAILIFISFFFLNSFIFSFPFPYSIIPPPSPPTFSLHIFRERKKRKEKKRKEKEIDKKR